MKTGPEGPVSTKTGPAGPVPFERARRSNHSLLLPMPNSASRAWNTL